MSFFFTKKREPKAAPKRQGLPPPRHKQGVATLHRLGCRACPLNNADIVTPKMEPTLADDTLVYFLAEAPGRDEDEVSGRPLTGPSGSLLRECIPDGMEDFCSFDNVVNCRPPKNRTPVWHEVECCRPRRVAWVQKARPRLIVGLGAVPMQAILGSSDMQGMRGRVFAVKIGDHACWYLPTYHPSYILRTAFNKKKPLNSKLGHCFRMDIQKAFRIVKGLGEPIIDSDAEIREGIQCFDGSEEDAFVHVTNLLIGALTSKAKAVDLETKGLRPYAADAAIMSAAISFENQNFSFAIDHPKSKWSKEQKRSILDLLFKILVSDSIKVAHNVPFELEWFIWLYGQSVVNHASWHCTMSQAHFLDERKGKHAEDDSTASRYQGLNFLVKQHFGINLKSQFKLNKKDMSQSDLGETLIYNGADTKYTLRLFKRQKAILKELGLWDAYLEALPRQPTVALMQQFGVGVNQNEVKRLQFQLAGEIEVITKEIYDLKVVKAYIKDHKEFNPASGNDVVSIFRDYLKRPEVAFVEEKTTRYSADKSVLNQIDHPLAQLIINLRNRSKLKSTYIDGLELGVGSIIYPDGKLHTTFNTTLTETGRLSSSEPNLQNYPKRNDNWVRKLIVPPKNHVMVAIDYGQLEACTGAMCSKDKYLTKALWQDYDIHAEWAIKIAQLEPAFVGGKAKLSDKSTMKKFRSLIKNKMVFPAFFGATNESVCGYLTSATGINVAQDLIDNIMDEFWETFTGVKKWQDVTMKKYYDVGYVESLTGRRHHYPLTRNQAINMPVQGTAAELVCDAMNRLSVIAAKTGQWHLHPVLNVHDDLSYFIPDDDKILEESLNIIIKEMLIFTYVWVSTPLSIEVSIGKNWAELEPIGKFWSHKEFGYPK